MSIDTPKTGPQSEKPERRFDDTASRKKQNGPRLDVVPQTTRRLSLRMMQVVIAEESLPAKLTLNPDAPMSDDDFYAFCMANPDARFERTAQGEIVIVPPAGGESDHRGTEASGELRQWAKRDGRGKTFGSSIAFLLPNGATLSPDAAWVSKERLSRLTREKRRKFLPVCPEFVIEVMSPSDRLPAAQRKMEDWIANGAELGWLIDGDNRTAYVYRAGRSAPEVFTGVAELRGEGPVAGLVMEMRDIWAGLDLD